MRELGDPALFREQAYIDGVWVDADAAATLAVDDPATGETLGNVPLMGAAETRRAIEAADRAWPAWRALTASERAARLREWHRLVLAHRDDLARIMTRECGKPLGEARGEVAYAASFIEWFAEEGRRAYGELIPSPAADRRIAATREPVGVSAAITPWNFPAAMITRKVAPALAAGCPAVVKPAEVTPFTALALAELADRAGIPAGVFNVVTGEPQAIGGELCANPTVRKLSFTGSTAVGRHLMAQCADTVKKVSLELGGNAPFIVFDDADLEAAVRGAMDSKFRNAGQTCVCANRILVQSGIHDAFVERLAEVMESELSVGNGLTDGINQGPLINDAAVEKVTALVADATAQGARTLTGGARHAGGGRFFQPTLLADVNTGMRLAREEIFGPVAPVFRFTTEDQAVAMANDTEYGLAAYFYSRDAARTWRVSEALEYGMVGINTGLLSAAEAPFGGMKASGLGREGARQGLEEYLETKYLCLGGIA
ncbi:Glutarate-semialdehyde dehydrogenase DavD [wastewater metagenome]|uniref:Glutarate-semialdehyde dehydrogenase DavD n=2 Tax=unclassified sequences TaxID=12908 RepID=A0A5B8RBH7_9ZZZZ|nr:MULTISPECIES: NAD-dependent succinate-semialdehyde dehydrogenase [Arhodomonas]QEA04125.1 glutarate-semialdehyde dehydrogenase DavD [uncultured organism]